jgi:hypothetical protein
MNNSDGIKVSTFERAVTMANILRGVLACESPDKPGDVA